jgi:FlaG/FlaF family flagellin (archaellin)
MEATTALHRSRAVSEVVSSVSMLAITIAVLGAAGVISLGSLRSANAVLLTGSQDAASADGVLLTVVSTQANSSGSYVWLFNYGWTPAHLTGVYLDGGQIDVSTTSCSQLQPRGICYLCLQPGVHGAVTIAFGLRTATLTL